MSVGAPHRRWFRHVLPLPALLATACAGTPPARAADVWHAALAELLALPQLAGGRIGVCVLDAADGSCLVAHEDDRGFAPASNQKLVTAAVALATLGTDHVMPTELWRRGELRDGTLHGDLVLRGHGDPTFGDGTAGRAQLAALVDAVRAAGVQHVAGRVVGDGGWLGDETLGLGWQWDYLDEDYAAPFGGLCCGGNVVTVRVRPGDGVAAVELEPTGVLPLRAAVRLDAAGARSSVRVRRPLGGEVIEVEGSIAADAREHTTRVPVPDPAAHAARMLAAALRDAGIAVDGTGTGPVPTDGLEAVAAVRSPRLAQLVVRLLRDSDNLYAEQFLRVAARTATGRGTTAAAAEHVRATLRRLGVDPAGMVVADGSGLSRRNLVQPRQLARLLLAVRTQPFHGAFRAGLPVAGETGTLRQRLRSDPARGRVVAKTGFIARVVCLSGYVARPEPDAPPLVFSVMLNDFTCSDADAKAAVDGFVQRLADAVDWSGAPDR